MTYSPKDSYYLGVDLSTQQLKCLAINQDLKIVHSETVEFGKDLPHFGTHKGVYIKGDRIESPVAMWLEALDLVLTKYQGNKFPLDQVVAMSGSCQQHGSVFWSNEASNLLEQGVSSGSAKSLVEQLSPRAFARPTAPNWQDHSKGKQCSKMEESVGGSAGMANVTGSRGHFRFTGPQILKIAQEEPEAYENTDTITLVSNFLSSILCGKLVGLEEADACGMNLYDVKERKFHNGLIQIIDDVYKNTKGKRVRDKLIGEPIKCEKQPVNLGFIGKYFVNKYGFQDKCSIFPFTGDNLATICSLPLQNNDILVSLGTSTTVLLVTDQYHPSPNYHLFIHPTIPKAYMGMICYCNGSLAREKVRDEINQNVSTYWDKFNNAVLDENLDTSNELGIYFPLGEIVPSVPAVTKRVLFEAKTGELDHEVEKFVDERHDAKNIVESQALSCRVRISPLLSEEFTKTTNSNSTTFVSFDHDKDVPLETYLNKRPKRAFFVGGGSKNDAIVNKFAEVLGATQGNYRLDTPNSCALGGCYKAVWSDLYDKNLTSSGFDTFLQEKFPWDELEHVCDSDTKQWEMYNKKIVPLSRLESTL